MISYVLFVLITSSKSAEIRLEIRDYGLPTYQDMPSQYHLQHILRCNDDSYDSYSRRLDSRKRSVGNSPIASGRLAAIPIARMVGRGVEGRTSTVGFPIKQLGLSYAGDVSGTGRHGLAITPKPFSSYRPTLLLFYKWLVTNNSQAQ